MIVASEGMKEKRGVIHKKNSRERESTVRQAVSTVRGNGPAGRVVVVLLRAKREETMGGAFFFGERVSPNLNY